MREALEGSQAIARAVSMCKPDVVAAYPITPQTHIVENLSKLVAEGDLHTEFVSVESEFSAASVVLGAAAAGARAYTATASQGVLLMSEVLFNIAGMRIPLVMTVANRAVSAPLSIWNDHGDSMAVRDCGLDPAARRRQPGGGRYHHSGLPHRAGNRTAGDGLHGRLHSDPHDGSHRHARSGGRSTAGCRRSSSRASLIPAIPKSLGTLVSPEFFAEIRHSHHSAMVQALAVIEETDSRLERRVRAAPAAGC